MECKRCNFQVMKNEVQKQAKNIVVLSCSILQNGLALFDREGPTFTLGMFCAVVLHLQSKNALEIQSEQGN